MIGSEGGQGTWAKRLEGSGARSAGTPGNPFHGGRCHPFRAPMGQPEQKRQPGVRRTAGKNLANCKHMGLPPHTGTYGPPSSGRFSSVLPTGRRHEDALRDVNGAMAREVYCAKPTGPAAPRWTWHGQRGTQHERALLGDHGASSLKMYCAESTARSPRGPQQRYGLHRLHGAISECMH